MAKYYKCVNQICVASVMIFNGDYITTAEHDVEKYPDLKLKHISPDQCNHLETKEYIEAVELKEILAQAGNVEDGVKKQTADAEKEAADAKAAAEKEAAEAKVAAEKEAAEAKAAADAAKSKSGSGNKGK